MTISYIKKANKTASSDEVETRQKVQDVLNEIESKRDEGIKEISRKFDKYEGDVIISQEKIEEVIKSLDQKVFLYKLLHLLYQYNIQTSLEVEPYTPFPF